MVYYLYLGADMESALQDRVVVVTGGSSGIGRAAAIAFGRERARVAVTYRADAEGAADCAREIEACGGSACTAAFDLTAKDGAAELVKDVTARWRRIDVLVNCAGGRDRNAPWGSKFEDTAESVWRVMIDADLVGPYRLLQAAVPAMRGGGWGRIVLVSSGAGEEGWQGAAPYATAKAGLVGLARSLAWELGPEGILVNVVAPGLTMTERIRQSLPPEIAERFAARVPSRRLSEPEDLAALIVFLASAANRNVSGELVREGSATGRSAHAG
jgi:NAD(P)-dependent dehydrogenase (short-subunit alcohol dehydrogenase family)